MGKYMRKAKVSGEVAVMEVAAAPLGVRTRARAGVAEAAEAAAAAGEGARAWKEGAGGEYLELRSRRLEKLPPPAREPAARRRAASVAAAVDVAAAAEQAEAELPFGENVLELEAMERETTPCSLIRDPETISTPGSTTRPSHTNSCRRVQLQTPVRRIIPSSAEMEEFFAAEEQLQQHAFIDKYNFDPVNDCPLPGRYEWVKLD